MKAHDNQKFLKILCDSLKFLAKGDNDTKSKILKNGGTHRVIGKMKAPKLGNECFCGSKLTQICVVSK